VSAVERGHLQGVTVERLRQLFAPLDARVLVEPRWRGAELERLLDEEHAAVQSTLASRLEREGWEPMLEVTYAIGGERGSIDTLAVKPESRAVLVAEVKTDVAAAEAVGRKLDEKRRLAPEIVRQRLGWTPVVVGAVLVMPESSRLRRLLAGQAQALARMFPIGSRRVASWLHRPTEPLAATWFLSDISARNARRVSVHPRGSRHRAESPPTHVVSVEREPDEPPLRILR
jgi:hypothetical protein